jgi:hypothetical protein
VSDSRRGILAPHAHDRGKWTRCPICLWAIDQDHSDALAVNAARAGEHAFPFPSVPATAVKEPEGTLEFALV